MFEAHCIECGMDISRSLQSHVLCHAHFTPEKAWNKALWVIKFCNVCGRPMFPGNLFMAHLYCELKITHSILPQQERKPNTNDQTLHF